MDCEHEWVQTKVHLSLVDGAVSRFACTKCPETYVRADPAFTDPRRPMLEDPKPQQDDSSLEDEMRRLLGELSAPARK